MASVEPVYNLLDGQDAVGYILSSNINRRHLTKGQRAMAVAMVCPFSGQTLRAVSGQSGLSRGLVGNAAVVIKHTPDAAPLVISGAMSLDAAYEKARNVVHATGSGDPKSAKEHKHVLRDIKGHIEEGAISGSSFGPRTYIDSRGEVCTFRGVNAPAVSAVLRALLHA